MLDMLSIEPPNPNPKWREIVFCEAFSFPSNSFCLFVDFALEIHLGKIWLYTISLELAKEIGKKPLKHAKAVLFIEIPIDSTLTKYLFSMPDILAVANNLVPNRSFISNLLDLYQ